MAKQTTIALSDEALAKLKGRYGAGFKTEQYMPEARFVGQDKVQEMKAKPEEDRVRQWRDGQVNAARSQAEEDVQLTLSLYDSPEGYRSKQAVLADEERRSVRDQAVIDEGALQFVRNRAEDTRREDEAMDPVRWRIEEAQARRAKEKEATRIDLLASAVPGAKIDWQTRALDEAKAVSRPQPKEKPRKPQTTPDVLDAAHLANAESEWPLQELDAGHYDNIERERIQAKIRQRFAL